MAFSHTLSWPISLVTPGWLKRRTDQAPAGLRSQSEPNDEWLFECVCRSQGGDPSAFDQLVARYRSRIVALVRRMLAESQSAIDPEDIAQEAFIDAYRRRNTFRRGAMLRPWLYGIAVNRCLDHLRTLGRESLRSVESHELDNTASTDSENAGDPLGVVMSKFETDALERGVAALPPKLRAVLILRYLDDMQYEEIAHALDMPVGTVKTNLFRARTELRTRMTNAQQE